MPEYDEADVKKAMILYGDILEKHVRYRSAPSSVLEPLLRSALERSLNEFQKEVHPNLVKLVQYRIDPIIKELERTPRPVKTAATQQTALEH